MGPKICAWSQHVVGHCCPTILENLCIACQASLPLMSIFFYSEGGYDMSCKKLIKKYKFLDAVNPECGAFKDLEEAFCCPTTLCRRILARLQGTHLHSHAHRIRVRGMWWMGSVLQGSVLPERDGDCLHDWWGNQHWYDHNCQHLNHHYVDHWRYHFRSFRKFLCHFCVCHG